MNRRALVGIFLAVLLIGAFAAWWFATFERVEEVSAAPLAGEARYNPLFGLKKVLEARGIKVDSRANFNARALTLDPNDTLILAADPRTLSHDDVAALLDFVESGGQLLFGMPRGSNGRNGELIDRLRLVPQTHYECVRWPIGDVDTGTECLPTFKTLEKHTAFQLLLGAKDGETYWLGRHAREDGAWTALGTLSFLYTPALKQPGYAAFAWQVLAPALQKDGTVHLVYATDVPRLHVLLVRYGWPALVPMLVALLAWLWLRSQRLGPLLPVATIDRRALREHIHAAGEFTFRRGRGLALYAPLRRAFDARLRRDDPALAALDVESMAQELAKRNGLSPAAVRMALVPQALADPERFHLTIKTLTQLRARP